MQRHVSLNLTQSPIASLGLGFCGRLLYTARTGRWGPQLQTYCSYTVQYCLLQQVLTIPSFY